MNNAAFALIGGLALAALVYAQGVSPRVKVLTTPDDPAAKTVLVGRTTVSNMTIMFEIEAAKGMWMPMGRPARWMEHAPTAAEKFHLEVKPTDPKSKTRIPYAAVRYSVINTDNGKKLQGDLLPMWGGSGLHYAANSPLAGDGSYAVKITVDAPSFGRAPADKDLWREPVSASFHFKLKDSKLVEVSEPEN
jgi:Fe2+ transport protein